jgi:hypothetical protein
MNRWGLLLMLLWSLRPTPAHAQVMIGGSATAISTTAGTYYLPLMGGTSHGTTENTRQDVMPDAGTFSKASFFLSAPIGSGNTAVFTFRKGAADQTITCTMSGNGIAGQVCQDLTHSVSVVAQDLVNVKMVTTGTPAAVMPKWGWTYTSTTPGRMVIMGGSDGSNLGASGQFVYFMDNSNGTTATENFTDMLVPIPGTVNTVCHSLVTAPGAGTSRTLTMRLNHASQTMAAVVSGTNKIACDSTTFAVTAGQRLGGITANSGAPAATRAMYSFSFDPTTLGAAFVSTGRQTAHSTSATEYQELQCANCTLDNALDSIHQQSAGDEVTITDMYLFASAAPGAGTSTTTTLINNKDVSDLAVTLSGGAQTTNNAAANISVGLMNLLTNRFVPTGTPAAIAINVACAYYREPRVTTPSATLYGETIYDATIY